MKDYNEFKKDPAINKILFQKIIKTIKHKAGIIGVYAPAKPEYEELNNPIIIVKTATGLYNMPLSYFINARHQQEISKENNIPIKKVDYSYFNYAEILTAYNE